MCANICVSSSSKLLLASLLTLLHNKKLGRGKKEEEACANACVSLSSKLLVASLLTLKIGEGGQKEESEKKSVHVSSSKLLLVPRVCVCVCASVYLPSLCHKLLVYEALKY